MHIKCVLSHSSGLHEGVRSVNALLSISVLRKQIKSASRDCVLPPLAINMITTLLAAYQRCFDSGTQLGYGSSALITDVVAVLHTV